jgi:hypothetical protein
LYRKIALKTLQFNDLATDTNPQFLVIPATTYLNSRPTPHPPSPYMAVLHNSPSERGINAHEERWLQTSNLSTWAR